VVGSSRRRTSGLLMRAQASLHPAREGLDPVVASLGELRELEQLVGAGAHLVPREAEEAAVDPQVLLDREVLVEHVLLRADPEPRADGRAVVVRVHAEDAQLAGGDR
jgi:hypothetical protein